MKKTLKRLVISTVSLYKKRYFWLMNGIALLCVAGGFGYVYWQLFPEILEQIAVPLHYNIHYGVDSFGDWRWIFLAPGLALGLIIFNNVLAVLFSTGIDTTKDRKWFFYGATAISSLLFIHAIIYSITGFGLIQFSSLYWLVALPVSILGILLVDDVLSGLFGKRDYVLSYMVIAVSTLTAILSLLAIIHIVNLNLNYYG